MDNKQFLILVTKLDDIKKQCINCTNKSSAKPNTVTTKTRKANSDDFKKYVISNTDMTAIDLLKILFLERLEEKTGWGRNQIKEIFMDSINECLALKKK